jgi:hypothetical protein
MYRLLQLSNRLQQKTEIFLNKGEVSFALLQSKAILPAKLICHAANDFCIIQDGTQAGSPVLITGVGEGGVLCLERCFYKDLMFSQTFPFQ